MHGIRATARPAWYAPPQPTEGATVIEKGGPMAEAWTAPFGQQLRRLREAVGITQEELAERAGLSRDAVGALESGRRRHPHPRTVRALSVGLGLSDREAAALR